MPNPSQLLQRAPLAYAASTSTSHWPSALQRRYASVLDTKSRDFNGSCHLGKSADGQDVLLPEAKTGRCVSYVPDVTAYCCGAVGGILEEYDTEDRLVATSAPGAASTRASNASATGTGVGEPECETTNYRDMLACFRFTMETHCSRTQVGPYGVCAPVANQTDTSSTSGAATASRPELSLVIAGTLSALLVLGLGAIAQ